MAKNGRFWPFYLVFSYCTVTISLLMLQNVSYHHTEQQLQTQSAHRCLTGLTITKKGPKIAKNGCFWPFCLNSSSSTVTISLLVLQNVRYYHPGQYLQTWRAHRCLRGLIIVKNGPKMVKNGLFRPSRLDSSLSTVTTSLLALQNISYYHTEYKLQTWSAYNCKKMAQTQSKTAVFCRFFLIFPH